MYIYFETECCACVTVLRPDRQVALTIVRDYTHLHERDMSHDVDESALLLMQPLGERCVVRESHFF